MHLRKGKKVFFYFFLFFLLGSINNIHIKNFNLGKIKTINVSGLDDKNNLFILNQIQNLNFDSIFKTKTKDIKNIFEENTIIENYQVFKIYPSRIDVNIKKTKFLAQIRNEGKIYFIGSNGKLSKKEFSNKKLPFIFGNPNINEFLEIKKFIDQSKFSFDQIQNLYFFQSRRWDLELKNKIVIKLPTDNIENSLDNVFNFINDNKSTDIKILDARVKNQIILNE